VLAIPDTEIEGGGLPDIAPNVRVEVEGAFGDAGELIAEEIEILPSAEEVSIKLEADVIGVADDSFALGFGSSEFISVRVNDLTQFEDNSSVPVLGFDIGDISNNDHIEVRGFLDGSSVEPTVIATRVERKDVQPDTKRKLKGPAANIDATPGLEQLTILNILVDPVPGAEIKPPDLFDLVQAGDIVGAGGRDDGGVIEWDELELEDD
jgi:hypothetical protein